MIDGIPLVDAHLHPARLSTLKMSVQEWAAGFNAMDGIYDGDGAVIPGAFDAYLEAEGVDVAIMFCEYSPLTTGVQPIEDLLPIAAANPARLRFLASVNPHLHDPLLAEVDRQLALGAVALKLHPVHARFAPNDAILWPVYARLQEAGLPVVFHCGTSVFPGAVNRYADPGLVDEVAGAFPDLKIVLAHGGRGLVVRRGGVHHPDAAQRVDRAGRPAAQEAAAVLPQLRPRPARPEVHLRHRLAGRAGHRPQRRRRGRPRL